MRCRFFEYRGWYWYEKFQNQKTKSKIANIASAKRGNFLVFRKLKSGFLDRFAAPHTVCCTARVNRLTRCTAQGRASWHAAYGRALPRCRSIGARDSAWDSVRHITARGLGRRAGARHGVPHGVMDRRNAKGRALYGTRPSEAGMHGFIRQFDALFRRPRNSPRSRKIAHP